MFDLTSRFCTATAQPFMNTLYYSKAAPCAALKPYIRCFWGTARPVSEPEPPSDKRSLVIPDGCVDIIFRADLDKGRVEAHFCGLDENGWEGGRTTVCEGLTSTFAVRFYLWSAAAFAEDSLLDSSNTAFPAERLFPGFVREMSEFLSRGLTLRQNAEHAERLLLKRLLRLPDREPYERAGVYDTKEWQGVLRRAFVPHRLHCQAAAKAVQPEHRRFSEVGDVGDTVSADVAGNAERSAFFGA